MIGGSGGGDRRGATFIEVMVAVAILAMVLACAVRVLWVTRRSIADAETGLRATIMLRELADGGSPASVRVRGSAGPGALTGERGEDGRIRIRYTRDGEDEPDGGSAPDRIWLLESVD